MIEIGSMLPCSIHLEHQQLDPRAAPHTDDDGCNERSGHETCRSWDLYNHLQQLQLFYPRLSWLDKWPPSTPPQQCTWSKGAPRGGLSLVLKERQLASGPFSAGAVCAHSRDWSLSFNPLCLEGECCAIVVCSLLFYFTLINIFYCDLELALILAFSWECLAVFVVLFFSQIFLLLRPSSPRHSRNTSNISFKSKI